MTLLKRDVDVNAIDSNGDTPIHLAVKVDSPLGSSFPQPKVQ